MWLQCGMALSAHMGDSGRSLWDQWSRQSGKYDERDQDKTWRSFRRNGIGIGTLFYHAKHSGWHDLASLPRHPHPVVDRPSRSAGQPEVPKDKARLSNFVFFGDAAPEPQMMLIDGVMPLQGLPFIGGQSSAGKTFVAILLACCAASGSPFMGREVKQRVGSVIVAAEGRSMLASRIAAALQKLGVTEPVPISWVRQVPDFSRIEAISEFIKDLRAISKRYQEQFGVPLGLVFVDTVSASFDIKEEPDNAEAARVCKIMRFVAEQAETLVVPIHHYGKNAGVGLRGASAWRANADFVLSVMADIDPQTGNVANRRLAIAKDRDGAQGPLTPFELEAIDLGVDEDGKPWGSLAAVAGSGIAQSASQWPSSLRTFRQALSAALINCATDERPFADGPLVRAVAEAKVREESIGLHMSIAPLKSARRRCASSSLES